MYKSVLNYCAPTSALNVRSEEFFCCCTNTVFIVKARDFAFDFATVFRSFLSFVIHNKLCFVGNCCTIRQCNCINHRVSKSNAGLLAQNISKCNVEL